VNAAVFASGSGSNFQAIMDREGKGALWRTRLLVVDRAGTGAVVRAEKGGIPVRHVPVTGRSTDEVGEETLAALREAHVDVIFLAGYLRLVPTSVVAAFPRRILNVHPALLPAFGGNGMWGGAVHEAVIESGARVTGVTVHFVDERFDEGTILAQWPVPVRPDDDASTLAARVLRVEHLLYPLAAQRLCRALAAEVEPSPLAPSQEAVSQADGLGESILTQMIRGAFRST
jgi:formyltetrahydrofolate-dependent phosphoribosylglycinamide formyltransferase